LLVTEHRTQIAVIQLQGKIAEFVDNKKQNQRDLLPEG